MRATQIALYAFAAAAFAVAAFFIVALMVIWPFRQLGAQAAKTVQQFQATANAADGAIDQISADADAAEAAIDSIKKTADAATPAVKAIGRTTDAIAPIGPAASAAIAETAANLNRPCQGPAGPDACGALASFSKAAAKAGDAIVQTQLSERDVLPHTIAAMDSLKGDADSLNAILKDQAITTTAQNIAGMTAHGNAILADAQKETDSLVAPKTTAQKIFGWLPTGLKLGAIAACLATGTPCP